MSAGTDPNTASISAGKSRRGRPSSVRTMNRMRFFELCADLMRSEVFPEWFARTKEALATWDHPHCYDVWRQMALIQGEVLAAGMQPEKEQQQDTLPFGADDLVRLAAAARDGAVLDDRLRRAAAPPQALS